MPRQLGKRNKEVDAKEMQVLQGGGIPSATASRILTVPRADGSIMFYIEVPDATDTLKFSSGATPGAKNHLYIDDDGIIIVENLDSATSTGAEFILRGLETTPADDDVISLVRFQGRNSASTTFNYAELYATSDDVTAATEDASVYLLVREAGAMQMPIRAKGNDVLFGSGTTFSNTPEHEVHVIGDAGFTGDLYSKKGGTDYDVYGYHPLSAPLTSTSFDGDSFSTTAKTLIDMSSAFSAPAAAIKAYNVNVAIRDSGSAAGDTYVLLHSDNTANRGTAVSCGGLANDAWARQTMVCAADSNGDIYYQIAASGASTFDMHLQIFGYWI